MRKIGITTTIPIEIVYAAGCVPVDLNNIFITSDSAADMVAEAEYDGYPRNTCGWIKGIYSTAKHTELDAVVAVVEGDCSQTQAMMETLRMEGIDIIPFAFPYGRDRDVLRLQIDKLIHRLGTTWEETLVWKKRLDAIRRKVRKLDELTWTTDAVSSFENHYFQINCSDFKGDPDAFEREIDAKLAAVSEDGHFGPVPSAPSPGGVHPERILSSVEGRREGRGEGATPRPKDNPSLRIGYAGIPSIFTDFYPYLESLGARVVFNEVQRQFAMPFDTDDIVEQYALYTYPYDIFARIEDIGREIERRSISGLIHYTQSFCFRQIQDLILRKQISVPILTLEGDAPARLDARTKVRIESFMEMLS